MLNNLTSLDLLIKYVLLTIFEGSKTFAKQFYKTQLGCILI